MSVCTNNVLSQKPVIGIYVTNSYVDKFVGRWKWSNRVDDVTIEFKKVKFWWRVSNYYQDVLMGCHSYVKNGEPIESTMSDISLIQPQMIAMKGSLLMYNLDNEGPFKIYGSLKDVTLNKDAEVSLTYISGSTPQMLWYSWPFSDIVFAPEAVGLTLPTNLVLVRQ